MFDRPSNVCNVANNVLCNGPNLPDNLQLVNHTQHSSVSRSHDTRQNRDDSRRLGSLGIYTLPGLYFKGVQNRRYWAELGILDYLTYWHQGMGMRVEHKCRRRRSSRKKGMPGIKPLVYLKKEKEK